ncbi:hypothetical protein QTG54_002449 [Skeletonema marinoi]|uniref:PDZ domain-containing protein n=1 Tax=Skeletonema marinoi TaxID=267567 RepID=A0AAD9DIP5_9STRA|nr:hypothetical protein QTG54_002449 [Skeletonema marinoi]
MAIDKLPRRSIQERQQRTANRSPPPPPPFSQPMNDPSSPLNTTSSTRRNRRSTSRSTSPRTTVLSRANYQASAFAPPPFAALSLSNAPTSSHRNPPPPPPRRSSVGNVTAASSSSASGSRRAHQIIRMTLQRPMGIVFAPNEELGYGVRIIDLPQQGAAAMSQQLCVGDALVSVNDMDCTMSNSKEIMTLIGQAEGNVDLAFLRSSNSPAPAVAAATSADGEIDQESTQSIQVVNLKWQDISSGHKGRYSGSVNQHMRPHGYGKFTYDQGPSLEGEWDNGVLFEVKAPAAVAADAAGVGNRRHIRRHSSKSSAASIHSQSQRNEGMSYATSIHPSSFRLSDYPNEMQQHQQLDGGQSREDSPVQYYCLGETIRSPQHMVQMASVEDTIQSVYTLQVSDFAFVMRSTGDWSFCQLIEREDNDAGEDIMTFCVNEVGHRKNLRPARWVKMVRSCSEGISVRPGGAFYGNDMESEPSF